MKKLLLATVALAGIALSVPGAQAAVLIGTVAGNDCSGAFGNGAGCVTTGTVNGTPLNQTPLIAKFDFNDNGGISATTIGTQFVGIITGAEFSFSGVTSGTLTYIYTPTGQDPLIQYVAAKGGPNFNLFAVGGSGTDTVFTPLNNGGNRPAFSHISFYDTSLPPTPVPEPASLLLFGAGLLGLGMVRRRRSETSV